MSVQCNTYVMQGVLFMHDDMESVKPLCKKFEPYEDSAFEGIKHHEGLCVLYDGMNGKYVAIGRVLAKTENDQGFDEPFCIGGERDLPPLSFYHAPDGDLPPDDLKSAIEALIERPLGWASIGGEIRTFVISHYR